MSWAQWPGSAAQPPAVVAAASAAPLIPPGLPYSTDQWTQMQQQNWQQWAQWQQQYQQWHQQYGAEYQKSISALAAQPPTSVIPNLAIPPPLPTETQQRPPLPLDNLPNTSSGMVQYTTQPPFSMPPPNFNASLEQKRAAPQGGESAPKRQMVNRQGWNSNNIATPPEVNSEELSDAEKKFDKQFAEWEAQYNKWKEQNSDHPDKQQFKEYEKKWEQWRHQLLDRRESMRRKRLGLMKNLPKSAGQFKSPDLNSESLQFKRNEQTAQFENKYKDSLGFLLSSKPDGIPGLDLVKDGSVEPSNSEENDEAKSKGPDLEAISKGINNILSDSKLMSMLSLVTKQNFNFEFGASSKNEQNEVAIQNFDDQTRSSFNEPIIEKSTLNNFETVANAPRNRNFDNFQPVNEKNDNYNDAYPEDYSRDFHENSSGFYGNGRGYTFEDKRSGNYNESQFNRNEKDFNQSRTTAGNFQRHEKNLNRGDSFGSNTMDAPDPPQFHNNTEQYENGNYENDKHSKEEMWKPSKVIDYNHKTLKKPEVEILFEPFLMFDYRHRSLRRIPYPERPNWLSDAVRMIPEFDPPIIRPLTIIERRPYESMGYPRRDYEIPRYERISAPMYEREYSHTPSKIRNFEDDASWCVRRNKPRVSPPLEYDENWKKQRKDERHQQQSSGWKSKNWSNNDDKSIFPITKSQNIEEKKNSNVTSIEDLINPPGRHSRPSRIVIILRGPPGSGKTHLAKIIKDKEVENGGSAPRILSLDDYFMVEQEKEIVEDGKKVKTKVMVYEFEAEMEDSYRNSLMKSFRKTITDGFFSFIIVDNVNDKVRHFGEMWSFAKQNGFQVYICQLELDVQNCIKRNIHNRTEDEIRKCISGWENTPFHHPLLDVTTLLQGDPISEVEMEEINSSGSDLDDLDEGLEEDRLGRSKWDNFDCSVNNLARLDGVSKPLRPSRTMEEYLQLEDEWQPSESTKPGQKRVRWADLEERKQQEKMRAIGFVVGQTDWDRMMDPTKGESALTQTKYIEKVGRRRFF